jgi:hypothetical protein
MFSRETRSAVSAIVVSVSFFLGSCRQGSDQAIVPEEVSSEERFFRALEAITESKASDATFDGLLNPSNSKAFSIGSYINLKKYVLADYYTADISDIASDVHIGSTRRANSWGAPSTWARTDSANQENGYSVSGTFFDEVRQIFLIASDDPDGRYAGKFHVYKYFLWNHTGEYGNVNV